VQLMRQSTLSKHQIRARPSFEARLATAHRVMDACESIRLSPQLNCPTSPAGQLALQFLQFKIFDLETA